MINNAVHLVMPYKVMFTLDAAISDSYWHKGRWRTSTSNTHDQCHNIPTSAWKENIAAAIPHQRVLDLWSSVMTWAGRMDMNQQRGTLYFSYGSVQRWSIMQPDGWCWISHNTRFATSHDLSASICKRRLHLTLIHQWTRNSVNPSKCYLQLQARDY